MSAAQRFALTSAGAGVDSAWEQEKLEASLPKVVIAQGKILDAKHGDREASHLPKRSEGSAGFVGRFLFG